ncbi:MAG: acyltransferase [Flexilinea sp.]|nr:acyltransferase [Flexilinea sp.]
MNKTDNAGSKKSYDSFDAAKFILCFLVMIVHTRPMGDSHFHIIHPWCRIIIPVYFMISAFLFFSKYDRLPDEEKNGYLWKFVKRDLTLYLFWFIVFLPFTIIYRDYLHKGIAYFIGSIILGSSFPASWYLIALAIAIIFVAKLNRGVGKAIVPVIAFLCYFLCLGQKTWRVLADQTTFLPKIYNATEISYSATFFVAIIWVWMGSLFARYKDRLIAVDMKKVIAAFVCSLVLLFFEDKWLFDRGLFTMNNDVYFFGLLAGPILFWIILKLDIHVPQAKALRVMSTLIYCIHATIAELLRVYVILPKFGEYEMPWATLAFVVTAVVTLAGGWLIMKYSDRFKILKFAF